LAFKVVTFAIIYKYLIFSPLSRPPLLPNEASGPLPPPGAGQKRGAPTNGNIF